MTTCPAGHQVPCPICGAISVDACNGGEYVPARTEREARRMTRITEVEKEAKRA